MVGEGLLSGCIADIAAIAFPVSILGVNNWERNFSLLSLFGKCGLFIIIVVIMIMMMILLIIVMMMTTIIVMKIITKIIT